MGESAMSPGPYFSPEPDPETVGTFGGYRSPAPPPQDDPPTDVAAADDGDPSEQLAAARMTPEQRRATYEALLQHPNVRAFLNTVANTEGDVTYDSLNNSVKGPKKFTDYSQFPLNDPGATASGRYQISGRPTATRARRWG
jgi:hypothetical protein